MAPFALRPSAASRWVKCGGYLPMIAAHPERPVYNQVREEGNAFHDVAAIVAKGQTEPAIDMPVGDGVYYSEEMADHVAEYVDEIRSWNVPAYIEQPLACPSIHPSCGGTPDAWAVDIPNRLIRLMDGKYGYRPVAAEGCLQLGCYLSGIVDFLMQNGVPLNGLGEQYWTFEFVIYQPRGRGMAFDRWRANIADYGRGLFNILRHGAHVATTPGAPTTAGPHCLDCPAAANCATLRTAMGALLDVTDVTYSDVLSPVEIGYELGLLDYAARVLKSRREALEIEAQHRISQGIDIPGHCMKPTVGRRRWNEGAELQVIEMAKLLGLPDISAPSKAITPTQAVRLIGEEMVAQFSHRPTGKPKLSPLSTSDIRKAFGKK